MFNREVFHCPVLISLWRIRHAWHKSLVNKCSDIEKRSAMAKRLGDAMSIICRGSMAVAVSVKTQLDCGVTRC
jgi:hypothetical protein